MGLEGENMKQLEIQLASDKNAFVSAWLQTGWQSDEMQERNLPAIVICPGGGYAMTSDREAEPIAKEYFYAGYHVFVLRYTVGKEAQNFKPLCQLAETVSYIRAHAEEWKVAKDKIAVCGFSAGGHLAASLGTMYHAEAFLKHWNGKDDIKPNAMILGYPVISADEYAQVDSIENVSGANQGEKDFELFGLEQYVDADTPPTFLWHTASDECVKVENSLHFAEALSGHNVPFELHILPNGPHGMSTCTQEVGSEDSYNGRWVEWSVAWLNQLFSFSK